MTVVAGLDACRSGWIAVVLDDGRFAEAVVGATFVDTLMALSKARSLGARVKALSSLKMSELVPKAPAIAESATGKSMGQHAEMMARKNHISREEQDAFALLSHQRAAAAAQSGKTAQEE